MISGCLEAFLDCVITTSPEKALLAAILERAYRDLGFSIKNGKEVLKTSPHLYRRTAVTWFRSRDTIEDSYLSFSYNQIKEELDLCDKRVKYIEQKVTVAEILLEKEREELKFQEAVHTHKLPPIKHKRKYERKVA